MSDKSKSFTLTQKAFLNVLSSFIDYFARLLVSLLVTPMIITGLGSMAFGIWQVLLRLSSHISVVDGQSTQALKWVIANNQSSDDFEVKRRAISSAVATWIFFLPLLIAIGTLCIWFTPTITKIPVEFSKTARFTCFVLVINLLLSGFATIPVAVLRGMNLGYKRMGIVAILNVLGGGLTAGAIYLNYGLIGISFAQLLMTIVTGLTFWLLVKKYIPWFGIEHVSLKDIFKFIKLSLWFTLSSFVNKLLFSGDVLILSILLSSAVVTDYVLTGYISQILISSITMIVGAAIPGLGGIIGQKKIDKILELRKEMLCLTGLLATVFGSLILMWNKTFISLWIGSEHYAGQYVNLLMVVIAVQLLFLRNETYLIDLTLDINNKVLLGLLSLFITIILAIFLIHYLKIIGLCISILLGRLLLTISYPLITGTFFGVSLFKQVKPLVRSLIMMTFFFYISTLIGTRIDINSWKIFVFYIIGSMLIISLMSFFASLSGQQRIQIFLRIKDLKDFIYKK